MAYILHINTKNSARRTLYFHKSAMQSRLLLQFCGATSHLCAVLVGKCLHICLAPVAKVIRHSTGVLCGHWGVLCDMVPCRVLCGRSTCVGMGCFIRFQGFDCSRFQRIVISGWDCNVKEVSILYCMGTILFWPKLVVVPQ